jgi:hypothetical protein
MLPDPSLEVLDCCPAIDLIVNDHVLYCLIEREPCRSSGNRHTFRDVAFTLTQQITGFLVLVKAGALFDPLPIAVVANAEVVPEYC